MNINKHRIAWIGLAVGIVLVMLITWMAGVAPCLDKIHNADEQTAQIDAQNEVTQKKIDQLMIASETLTIQKARLKQLQRQLPENFNQSEFITALDGAAAGSGVSIKSVTFDDAVEATLPSESQKAIVAGHLVEVPLTITASGSYDAMRSFVDSVQKIERIAVPNNVTYSIDAGGDDSRNSVVIECDIWSMMLSGSSAENKAN
ncbi:type 4a pilus biogenesis protein PilO [Bifidobacterium sp. 64T4]|uniref:type 4a pilus biogenesis protein PilO n=1 Tax=Bifidobacterium pongonis TaxID=2834432 RepID=UPI001C5A21CE|nr:type 4a pilus biogenesis protein PilO [Bifidobacterium pongonis]MBW3095515.1 type 4a pilus biogenesis protein PilO [Bifidobacterium pongonis]